jgi:hypothetical protein
MHGTTWKRITGVIQALNSNLIEFTANKFVVGDYSAVDNGFSAVLTIWCGAHEL